MPQSPCPYCGHVPESPDAARCDQCGGLFEPLSRKATQLAMGPWFVRDEERPFMPGFSEAILRHQVASGRVKADTIVRGPTTNQFWMRADQTPGLSRLLGKCHACNASVAKDATSCTDCHADLSMPTDLDRLGLAYVEPADRQQAQAEVDAQRTAPTPKPKPAPKQAATVVSADLLEPVTPAHEPQLQAPEPPTAPPEPEINPYAEDLWHSDAPVATRRRRRRKSGADPLVVGLGVMLLCVIGIGLFIMVAGGDENEDPGSPSVTDNQPVGRTSEQVERISSPARVTFKQLEEQDVPPKFADTFAEAGRLIERAEREQENGRLTEAYNAYAEAHELLKPLPGEIAQWQANQEARAEATATLDEVKRLQTQAEQANAEQYAAVFSQGKLDLTQAIASLDKGEYANALSKAEEARGSFEQAIETAQEAAGALAAKDALIQAMGRGASEETLRQHAAEEIDRLDAMRRAGADKFNGRDYAESKQAFDDALAALRQAEALLELARYRKFYAYQAGYEAAGVLLAIAAGDDTDTAALSELFSRLRLADNPASKVPRGPEPDYAAAADALVNAARTAITARHGEAAQACYHAGFQVRIIEQSLATEALTKDQQQRIHQTLSVLQDRAAAGGWDIVRLRPAVEQVRAANRRASLGKPPEQTREAFAVLIKPLENRASAARLMDPLLSPSSPSDPELFPGLGSSQP